MKYIQILLLLLCPVLALTSCDFDADEIAYEDVMGMYRGEGEAFLTVNEYEGLTLSDGTKLNYGDTLVNVLKSPEPLEMAILVNTEDRLMFVTSIPMIQVHDRLMKIGYLGVDKLPVTIKGNHIISWGVDELETSSMSLPIETVYIPINNLDIDYEEDGKEYSIKARGYVAVSIVNYTVQMDLMIEEAPGFLTEGCALWLKYKGMMYSKEIIKERL